MFGGCYCLMFGYVGYDRVVLLVVFCCDCAGCIGCVVCYDICVLCWFVLYGCLDFVFMFGTWVFVWSRLFVCYCGFGFGLGELLSLCIICVITWFVFDGYFVVWFVGWFASFVFMFAELFVLLMFSWW